MSASNSQPVNDDPSLAAIWGLDEASSPGQVVDYYFFPDANHPRLIVPRTPTKASSALLASLRDSSTQMARIKTMALAASVRTGLGTGTQLSLPSPAVTTAIASIIGHDDLVAAIHVGPPRANRKPVLALSTPDGELIGFAKVAINELTQALVINEAAALDVLPTEPGLQLPRVTGIGQWRGLPVVVQSPVSDVGKRISDAAAVTRAQRAIANSVDVRNSTRQHLMSLESRIQAIEAADTEVQAGALRLRSVVDDLLNRDCVDAVPCGAWHGDWRHTNMAVGEHGVAVWDWERYAVGVPLGFDAVHLAMTSRASSGHEVKTLVSGLFDQSRSLLRPFCAVDPAHADFVVSAYLAEFATRSLEDGQSRLGGPLGDVQRWLLPELEARRTPAP